MYPGNKMANLLHYINCSIAGPDYASKKKMPNFPSFVAGYLQEMIQMKEFENVLKQISEKIKHLSFLVHLMCRYEDFEKVLSEYESFLKDLAIENIGWDDDKYFRKWELLQITKISKEDYETVIIDSANDEMQSFYGDEILEVEKTKDLFVEERLDPAQIEKLKNKEHITQINEQTQKKKEGLTKHLKYKCKECNDPELRLTNKKALARHLYTIHYQRLCEYCGKGFNNFEKLWRHKSFACSGVSIRVSKN